MSSHAIIKVILRSKSTIDSPILTQEEAAKELELINAARVEGTEIATTWISVFGGDIEAAHLIERAAPSSFARARLG